jgi:hypothetical protein
MFSISLVKSIVQSLKKQAHDFASWGDAQATKALNIASAVLWAPVTVPYAAYQFSLSLYPVQAYVLKPALDLQVSKTVKILVQ